MSYEMEDKLLGLKIACNRHLVNDRFSDWVYLAIVRHIGTGRATAEFCQKFMAVPEKDLPLMITRALRGDKSDDAIIRKVKTYLHCN